jgi:hypothetical protein
VCRHHRHKPDAINHGAGTGASSAIRAAQTRWRCRSVQSCAHHRAADAYLLAAREGTREADYVEGLVRYSQEYDRAGDGLDKADIDEQMAIRIAFVRAQHLTQMMSNDLDGDGFVTGEEAMRIARARLTHSKLDDKYKSMEVMQAYTQVLRFDDDGDRKVTVAEYLKRTRHHIQVSDDDRSLDMLDLDPDRDGHLIAAEVRDIASRVFRTVDTDIDGIISREEYSNEGGPRRMAELDQRIGPCRMTPPRDVDLFVHLYIYAAKWQPDVTIAGQYGETKLARVRIEPGAQPIHLVLSSYNPTIWQFEGAVERLAHVTVSPGYLVRAGEDVPGGGTIGVPADRVEFLRPGSCHVSYKSDSSMGDEGTVARAFMRGAGRLPDKSINPYGFENFAVPSGDIVKDSTYQPRASYEGEAGGQLHEWEDFYADTDEVVAVDPASVLAPGPVERYADSRPITGFANWSRKARLSARTRATRS